MKIQGEFQKYVAQSVSRRIAVVLGSGRDMARHAPTSWDEGAKKQKMFYERGCQGKNFTMGRRKRFFSTASPEDGSGEFASKAGLGIGHGRSVRASTSNRTVQARWGVAVPTMVLSETRGLQLCGAVRGGLELKGDGGLENQPATAYASLGDSPRPRGSGRADHGAETFPARVGRFPKLKRLALSV